MTKRQADLFPAKQAGLASSAVEFLRSLLVGAARPSAREVLRAMERALGPQVQAVFVSTLEAVAADNTIRRADRAYLHAMLQDGSVEAALHGEGRADEETVSSIDALIRQSTFYRSSVAFREMVTFMGRFREYAPYNIMLVRLQNPSCGFFATEKDWRERHGRWLVEDARPMVILAPMHPVMLVYDLDQTEGATLPQEIAQFSRLVGDWNPRWLANLIENARRHRIRVEFKVLSSTHGGLAGNLPGDSTWKMRIAIHDKLDEPSRFGVLLHEMAHIFLGHLGTDRDHWWPGRFNLDASPAEIEAETVAHLITTRFGLKGASAAYLAGYVGNTSIPERVSMDLIAKVAGELERMAKGLLPEPKARPAKLPMLKGKRAA